MTAMSQRSPLRGTYINSDSVPLDWEEFGSLWNVFWPRTKEFRFYSQTDLVQVKCLRGWCDNVMMSHTSKVNFTTIPNSFLDYYTSILSWIFPWVSYWRPNIPSFFKYSHPILVITRTFPSPFKGIPQVSRALNTWIKAVHSYLTPCQVTYTKNCHKNWLHWGDALNMLYVWIINLKKNVWFSSDANRLIVWSICFLESKIFQKTNPHSSHAAPNNS